MYYRLLTDGHMFQINASNLHDNVTINCVPVEFNLRRGQSHRVVYDLEMETNDRTEKEMMFLSIYRFLLIIVLLNIQVLYNTVVLMHNGHI